MIARIYLRASTQEQNPERMLNELKLFADKFTSKHVIYSENISGTKINRPELNRLLDESEPEDLLIVESVDRLSRLATSDFEILKDRIKNKNLRLIVADLPTTWTMINTDDEITSSILNLVNNLLIDLLATMSRLDNEKRKERIKQGLANSGYKATGKKPNTAKHQRILELYKLGSMTNQEIADAAKTGLGTVYRVLKDNKDITA